MNVHVTSDVLRCVETAELQARVSELSASEAIRGAATLDVSLSSRAGGGFAAVITLRRGVELIGERRVETANPDCRDIDPALLVVIDALLAITDETEPPEAPPPTSRPEADRAVTRPATTSKRPPPAGERPSRAPATITLGAAYALGVVPDGQALVRADMRIPVTGAWAFRVGAGLTPGSASRELEGSEIQFRSFSGRALGCVDLLGERRAHLDTCAGVEAGVTRTTQTGTTSDGHTNRPAFWPLATFTAAREIVHPYVAELSTAFGPALVQDHYEISDRAGNQHRIYETAPVRWEVGLALGAAF